MVKLNRSHLRKGNLLATDTALVIDNLCSFYDFGGKTVLSVGSGGGQFVNLARRLQRIIAIDNDPTVLRQLRIRIETEGLADAFEIVQSSFEDFGGRGDTVLFEFCLHEMPDPAQALQHARSLAPDILVVDHWPGSEWLYYTVEQDKVDNSTEAMNRFAIRSRRVFQGEQRFKNHDDLLAKVSVQGADAVARARRFLGVTDIVIPMAYAATLL